MSDEKKIVLPVVEINGRLQVLPDARASIMAEIPGTSSAQEDLPKPSLAKFDDTYVAGYRWAPWGDRDNLPTEIRRKLLSVPMAGQAVYKLVQMMFGNGLGYYRNEDLYADEGATIKRAKIRKIDNWLRLNRIHTHYLPAQFSDYRFYMNAFSEVILTNDRKGVAGLYHKAAEFCRLSVQNERSYLIDYLYYSPKFAEAGTPLDSDIRRIKLMNHYAQESFLDSLRMGKFAWHSRFETPGAVYYATPFWLGLFKKNGWIDASAQVSEVVNAMMRNQIILKYHILIPETYFEIRYPDWASYTFEQRNQLIDKLIDTINTSLAGGPNAFASIATIFRQDHVTQQAMGKIEIIAVDDKIKSNAWVPSSDKSDAQIVQSLGLHPSQVGLAPEGGKMGAGSGSDQRESFNTGITLNTIDQQILLEPLNWIAQYNAQYDADWDVTFFIDHTYHTTTNNQESGLQPSDTSIIIE